MMKIALPLCILATGVRSDAMAMDIRKRPATKRAGSEPRNGKRSFFLWFAHSPLKSPKSDEGIQGIPNPFSWFGLVSLGPAWLWLGEISARDVPLPE
jgi:hypothetical protein